MSRATRSRFSLLDMVDPVKERAAQAAFEATRARRARLRAHQAKERAELQHLRLRSNRSLAAAQARGRGKSAAARERHEIAVRAFRAEHPEGTAAQMLQWLDVCAWHVCPDGSRRAVNVGPFDLRQAQRILAKYG